MMLKAACRSRSVGHCGNPRRPAPGGPVLAAILSTALSGAAAGAGPATTAPGPDAATFRPSTAGKKLLLYGGPSLEEANALPPDRRPAFDGLINGGGGLVFRDRLDEAEVMAWAEKTAAMPFGRYTDNFTLCYAVPGQKPEDFDWFDDLSFIIENWRIMGAAARRAGFKGICFDSEYYEGHPLFGYARMRHAREKSFQEYAARVRQQAAEMMKAACRDFPDIAILLLFGYSGSFNGVPQHPNSRQENYTLVAAFVDGLLSACPPGATVHDMHEQAFSFRVPGSYRRARAMMKDLLVETSHDPDRYRRHHRAGFSFWADCWENASEGRPFSVEVFDLNFYTPHEFAYSLHHALAWSDRYVWMWPGVIDWWKQTARTVDAEGRQVVRPLPAEYFCTLEQAHQEYVPEPPRRRRPNTYRNEPAARQEGFSDEETFGDLWRDHEPLGDLPETWRFRIDPDETGRDSGWHLPACDDSDWQPIRIREFWENQGFSPYDGQAWYRLRWTPPELPPGRRIFLAFGAVADEAQVFVGGRSLYASPFGRNIRHERFLVDVTDVLAAGRPADIAVRVWNTGWCGGIWKSVKLIASK